MSVQVSAPINATTHPDFRYVQYALDKPGSREDYPFGFEPLVIKVLSKMFVIVALEESLLKLSLKCDPLVGQALRLKYPAVQPGYHLNKAHWNTVSFDGTIPEEELLWMIDHSYELVFKSLTKAERISLSQVDGA